MRARVNKMLDIRQKLVRVDLRRKGRGRKVEKKNRNWLEGMRERDMFLPESGDTFQFLKHE